MDDSGSKLMDIKFERAKKALKANNMLCDIVDTRDEAARLVESLIEKGSSVGVGGSMTLFELGLIDRLRKMDIDFLDRYADGLSREEVQKIYHDSLNADYYLCSSNAVTMQGELFNCDGNGNRVAAMIYGPKKVIVIVGANKLVSDLESAMERLKSIAAPANNLRLHTNNPCTATGKCMECKSEGRICCSYVVMRKQINKDRIHVILVKKTLGY